MNHTHTPYLEKVYGFTSKQAKATPIEVQEVFAKIILVVSHQGGPHGLTHDELAEWLSATGHPDALSHMVLGFTPVNADIEEMLSHLKALLARTVDHHTARVLTNALLYDAARLLARRHVSAKSRKSELLTIGRDLGVDARHIENIHAHVALEVSSDKHGKSSKTNGTAKSALGAPAVDATTHRKRKNLLKGAA